MQFHNGASCVMVAVIPCASVTVLAASLQMHTENADALLEMEKIICFFSPDYFSISPLVK